MSRLLLSFVLILCVGCGDEKKAVEEKAAPKVEAPAVNAAATPPAPTAGTADGPPDTIDFPSAYGDVKFTHRQHFERANNVCATCHPNTFPMAREPLNYGKARHRDAEEYKTSCAICHGISGTAFAAERNCQRCHDMKSKQ